MGYLLLIDKPNSRIVHPLYRVGGAMDGWKLPLRQWQWEWI